MAEIYRFTMPHTPTGPDAPAPAPEPKPESTPTPTPNTPTPNTPTPDAPAPKPPASKPEDAPKNLNGLSLNDAAKVGGFTAEEMSALEKEVDEKGDLSPETYAKLTKEKGLPEPLVRRFVEGSKAQAELAATAIMNEAGGVEGYRKMQEWANNNLPPADRQAFNEKLNSRDVNVIREATKNLYNRYQAEYGRDPNLTRGTPGPSGAEPFRSVQQMIEAMKDKRYSTDPAYRADVERRIEAGSRAGFI